MLKRHLIAVLAPVTLLAGCAGSGYGSSISGSGDALSPEERRLQAVEGKVTNLTRRLDSINLTGMDQESQRLRDDIRALRGEFERMRYDNDQQARRNKDLYMDLDRRLQRFEAPMGMNSSAVPPALPSTGMTTLPPTDGSAAAPAAGTAYGAAAASAPAVAAPPAAAPASRRRPPTWRPSTNSRTASTTTRSRASSPCSPNGLPAAIPTMPTTGWARRST